MDLNKVTEQGYPQPFAYLYDMERDECYFVPIERSEVDGYLAMRVVVIAKSGSTVEQVKA